MKKIKSAIKNIDSVEKSGIINMAIKPLSLILALLYTPLLISYLGNEKYGLWATILSMISWINYFDVGIGNGLRNVLSKDVQTNDYEHANKAVSTSYVVLSCISLTLLVLLLIITATTNWNGVFSTSVTMRPTLAISFVFICINFVVSLINTIQYALQKSEGVAIRGCIIQVINITGLLILSKTSTESLERMAVLFGFSTLLVNAVTTFFVVHDKSFLRPSIKEFDKGIIRDICNTGLRFFIIQIMCLLMFTVDNLLISHFFGPEEVTPFSIANKVYYVGYSILAAFIVPYWSGTTAAVARRDFLWIKKSIRKVIRILLLFIIGCIIVTIVFKPVVYIWLHRELNYQPGLIVLMCVFYILYAILSVECQFINGTGELTVQLIMYVVLGITNIPLSILLGVAIGMKSFGIRLATAFLVLIADVILGINLFYIIGKLEKTSLE